VLKIIALPLKTRHFQRQLGQAKGSCRPIFKVKTGFVSEKSHFSFAMRESWEDRWNCPKIASENGLHTENARFLPIFKRKKLLPIPAISTYLLT